MCGSLGSGDVQTRRATQDRKAGREIQTGGSSLSEGAKRDSDLQVLLLDCPGEEVCVMTEHPQTGGAQSR